MKQCDDVQIPSYGRHLPTSVQTSVSALTISESYLTQMKSSNG